MDNKTTTSLENLYLYGSITLAATPALALILVLLDIIL